ncbi:MAG: glycosyltransferase family 2 protein [Bacteroidota bacterium]
MYISGCIILRNAIINDYPAVEAIKSVLPLVDEMVVSIDPGDDNTLDVITALNEPKIKIITSAWDMTKRTGGVVYAEETNKVLDAVRPDSTWILYIQADEVLHEKDYSNILEAAKKYRDHKKVKGLLFRYIHFYGTYDYIGSGRQWYNAEVRMIKNDKSIRSYKDAQGFRIGNKKIPVAKVDADIYHYGWVKSPKKMKQKIDATHVFYNNDDIVQDYKEAVALFKFDNFRKLEHYQGAHPQIMKDRIESQNWHLDFDVSINKYALKDRLLMYLEKITGVRLFAFRNYTIVRS